MAYTPESAPTNVTVRTPPLHTKLPAVGTTIFSVMSAPAAPNMSEPMPWPPRLASWRRE